MARAQAVVPAGFNGATPQALAEQRKREAERKCADLVDGAWAWVDSRRALAGDDISVFAAQAITLKRIPAGLTSAELERWIVDAFNARENA